MIINEKIKNKLPIKNLENCYVITDFDRTISAGDSPTSWSVLEGNPHIPKEYIDEAKELYKKYRPIEINESLDFDYRSKMVKEWAHEHIELFVKYNLDESLFNDTKDIKFRNNTEKFLNFLNKNNIPVIIISAGIENLIESFLKKNECFYDNVHVCSNKIYFKNGKASGVNDNIIHSLNKNTVKFNQGIINEIKNKEQIILFGDQISDVKMVNDDKRDNTIKIGFLTKETKHQSDLFQNIFDIVCEENEGFENIIETLFK